MRARASSACSRTISTSCFPGRARSQSRRPQGLERSAARSPSSPGERNGETPRRPTRDRALDLRLALAHESVAVECEAGAIGPRTGSARRSARLGSPASACGGAHFVRKRSERDVVEIARRQVTASRIRELHIRRGTNGDNRATWPRRRSTGREPRAHATAARRTGAGTEPARREPGALVDGRVTEEQRHHSRRR